MEINKFLKLMDIFIEDSPELRHLIELYLRDKSVLL
jgi:hypothetical protein